MITDRAYRPIGIILNLIGIALIVHLSVDIFYTALRQRFSYSHVKKPPLYLKEHVAERSSPSLKDFNLIVERDIFKTKRVIKKVEPEPVEDIDALKEATLDVALIGTVVGAPSDTYAIIREKKGKKEQNLYRVGDSIKGAVIKKILRGKVILRVGSQDQVLSMEEVTRSSAVSSSSSPISKGSIKTISRAQIRDSMRNLNRLMSQIHVRPYFSKGRQGGFVITSLRRGSIFERLGFRRGDVVRAVDGNPIRRPDDVINLYEKLRSASEVSIQVLRGGREQELRFRID